MTLRLGLIGAAILISACDGVRTPVQPSLPPVVEPPRPSVIALSPLVKPGEYSLTLTADPACSLPDFVRQRMFSAQISYDPWDPFIVGQITGATIRSTDGYDFWLDYGNLSAQRFYIGNYLENFGIMEEIAGGLVLLFGEALIVPNGSKVSGHVAGRIGYCAGPAKSGSLPSEACRNPPVMCQSDKHQIDLERR